MTKSFVKMFHWITYTDNKAGKAVPDAHAESSDGYMKHVEFSWK